MTRKEGTLGRDQQRWPQLRRTHYEDHRDPFYCGVHSKIRLKYSLHWWSLISIFLLAVPVNSINCFACSNDASSTAGHLGQKRKGLQWQQVNISGSSLPSCADESSLAKIECSASKSCMETIETVNNVTRGEATGKHFQNSLKVWPIAQYFQLSRGRVGQTRLRVVSRARGTGLCARVWRICVTVTSARSWGASGARASV